MSIIVSGIRISFHEPDATAIEAAIRQCGLTDSSYINTSSVYRTSIDARHGKISRVVSVLIDGVDDEKALIASLQSSNIRYKSVEPFSPVIGNKKLNASPIVIGMGPAGLFAGYMLAKYGYHPIILERGESLDQRDRDVSCFCQTGLLNTNSNIQFGEGGAGAYSDGKLTTRINDPLCDEILRILVSNGAPGEIVRLAKPHVGTDILKIVVRNMRKYIIARGGTVYFHSIMNGIHEKNGNLCAIELLNGEKISCEQAVLAIGHSARDTFSSLHKQGVVMEPKPFSVGVRIEHLQQEINHSLYGSQYNTLELPPAEYALSHREKGRACYTFCMCPGGQVVAAQSEEHTIVTNGMSYHARDQINANSAVVVSVNPSDFDQSSPLAGVSFQHKIEQAAYLSTESYRAPCQTVGDFMNNRPSSQSGYIKPSYPLGVEYGSVISCLPAFVADHLQNGLRLFGKKIRGFDSPYGLLTGPETRTSSPVRILRGQDLYSTSLHGLIPCGEGAGYAGGIMSAAVDGVRAACRIMEQYAPI